MKWKSYRQGDFQWSSHLPSPQMFITCSLLCCVILLAMLQCPNFSLFHGNLTSFLWSCQWKQGSPKKSHWHWTQSKHDYICCLLHHGDGQIWSKSGTRVSAYLMSFTYCSFLLSCPLTAGLVMRGWMCTWQSSLLPKAGRWPCSTNVFVYEP